MVTASPTSQILPVGSDSRTIQEPVDSPGPAHDTDAAPAMEILTSILAQSISSP